MAQLRSLTQNNSHQPMPLYSDMKKTRGVKLDLNAFCIRHPTNTFFIHVENTHLIAWGIEQDDLLIIESGLQPEINDLFVTEHQGQYRFYQFFSEINGEKILFSLDINQPNIRIKAWDEIKMAGVITNVVHQMRNRTSSTRYAA